MDFLLVCLNFVNLNIEVKIIIKITILRLVGWINMNDFYEEIVIGICLILTIFVVAILKSNLCM